MTRARHALWPCALAVLVGCWATPVAFETRSIGDDQPISNAPRNTTVPRPTQSGTQTSAEIDLSTPPPDLEPEDYAPAPTSSRRLSGGVVAMARGWDGASIEALDTAILRLTLPIGSGAGDVGLAELTAWTVAEAATAAEGTPSLRRQVESMGGDLDVRIGSKSSSFDVTLPTDRWEDALSSLMAAIVRPTNAEQVETVRRKLVSSLRRELARPGLENLLSSVAQREGVRPEDYLAGIEDRSADDVTLFHQLGYQPAGAVLSLWVPGMDPEAALESAAAAVETWAGPDAPSVDTPKPDEAHAPAGIYWAPNELDLCHFAMVLPVPHLAAPRALETLVLLECLTMDGVGGRLGDAMRDLRAAEIALRRQPYWNGSTRHLVLWARAPRDSVSVVWEAWERARRSLFLVPPTHDEIVAAANHLRLRLMSERADPRLWLEEATSEGLRGEEPADLGELLSQLESAFRLDLEGASRDLIGLPSTLIVLGSEPPPEADSTHILTEAFAAPDAAEVPAQTAEQMEAALPYLDAAMNAMGGRRKLAKINGFSAAMRRTTVDGANMDVVVWYRNDGYLRLRRKILRTDIETIVLPDKAVEFSGTRLVTLEEKEMEELLQRNARHPLMILAGVAREELKFRLVSLRTIGDRQMAVLEQVDASQRLRLIVDAESGLTRTVETREWRSDLGTHVQVAEEFSDYRTAGAVRVPFFQNTRVDGREHLSTTFGRVVGETPRNEMFARKAPKTLPPGK